MKKNNITDNFDVQIEDLKSTINVRLDIPKLFALMSPQGKSLKVCEIGVKEGSHFKHTFLRPQIIKCVAIDIWKDTGTKSQNDDLNKQTELDDFYQRMIDLSKTDPRVQVIREFSDVAAQQFEDNFFDFVYIDADHTKVAVEKDIMAWWPKVRSGGVLAGHDYVEIVLDCGEEKVEFGVIPAVNEFVANNKLDLHVDNDHPWKSWFVPKP